MRLHLQIASEFWSPIIGGHIETNFDRLNFLTAQIIRVRCLLLNQLLNLLLLFQCDGSLHWGFLSLWRVLYQWFISGIRFIVSVRVLWS